MYFDEIFKDRNFDGKFKSSPKKENIFHLINFYHSIIFYVLIIN